MHRNLYAFLVLNLLYLRVDCGVVNCLKPRFLLCDNGRCTSSVFECDGENDCGDMSDEKNCENFKFTPPTVDCAIDEFQCRDYSCIPAEKFCDNHSDCPDKSDEYEDCVKELKCDGFRCKDGHCVQNLWVCDGVADCPDKSDEMNCANKTFSVEECNSGNDRYLCKNQRCTYLSLACNNKDDCGDGSDENTDGCRKAELLCTRSARCNHFCRRTPAGPACSCQTGYKLLDNRTCTDVNECEIYGTCDQSCVNSAGSYRCACQSGYNLQEDKKTCRAEGGEALLIFSVKSEIRGLYLRSEVYFPITRNLKHAVGVSLDATYVYWADIEDGDEAIIRSLEDGSKREVIVTTGLGVPEDIAVDWITRNIYFTDSDFMHIGVCTNNGSYCTVLLKERSDKPRGIALLPSKGVMYWSEWGSTPHISMASMDGKDSKAFITTNLGWPNGLAIDYANNRLYWVDPKLKVIETARLDGSDRRTVLHGIVKQPFSLAVFENKLYWSDWASNTIQSCDKFTGKDWQIMVRENTTVYGIHIYHSVLKPQLPNPCNAQPCPQICLLNRNDGYTCACSLDKELNADQHTCRSIKKREHLIIAAGNTFIDYYHELLGKPKMTASITLKHITAVTYNSLTGAVLASDRLTDSIFHFNTNNGELKSILSLKNELLGGMDFDYIGNNLYLSDIEHRTIEVHSFSTNEKTIFYFQDQPYDIALVPEESIMFVVFFANGYYRIDKLQMNGIGVRLQIMGNNLVGPQISLCYDKDIKRLFWSDQGTGRILSATIDGNAKYLFRTGLYEPVSLATLGEHVFWTQHGSNQLYWADKYNTHQYQKRITLRIPNDLNVLHLVTKHATYVNKQHDCLKNNGNCSHVCLLSSRGSYICACPPDMMLSADNRTCIVQTACNAGEIKCGEHDVCIKFQQRCDGVRDCPNGEDESSICAGVNSCADDQFKCKSGECISSKKRCNSHYDCADRSDEEGCDKKDCQTNEFQCREGNCIAKSLVCNGKDDCNDFSDELNCAAHVCDADSFMCKTGTCIPKTWVCDGQRDCQDGSDEGERCRSNKCRADMFACGNGRCIDSLLKCNGVNDCEDFSDEQHCTIEGRLHPNNCTEEEYRCYNTDTCLPKKVRCNGVQDCPKNDDEHNCVRCQKGEFACDNRKCILESWVCDMYDDCGDKSDERDCGGDNSRKVAVSSSSNCEEFRCTMGKCLPFSKVCDEIPDCPDGTDELGQCTIACTKNNPCQTVCHNTPKGPVCGCQKGFRLGPDTRSCEDVNECDGNICSQICRNTYGSFTCSCYEGYVLQSDGTSCKIAGPQMEMITVVRSDIRKLTPSLSSIEVLHEELNFDITGIDINANDDTVYWSNDALGMISKLHIKTKELKTVTGVGKPEALALDWVTDNVYFYDNDKPCSIKVCNLEQHKCASLITLEGGSRAMSIAVDPKDGWLFWSQTNWQLYNDPSTEIYRSDTMGANMTVVAFRNIGVVTGLAIDYMRSQLYWTDTFNKVIEVSNFDGTNRARFLETDIYQPVSITIYEDSLYWLMGVSGQIQKCKLHGDKSCTTTSIGSSNVEKLFTIMHISRQPFVENTCDGNKCEHMCILRKDDFACICPNGYPADPKNACEQHSNAQIKFVSSKGRSATESVQGGNGTLIGVVIMVLICILISSGYCYYQNIRPYLLKKNDVSIRFQNSSSDQRSGVVTSLNCISGLPPGEHEYTNPVIYTMKEKSEEKGGKSIYSDQSDGEPEDSEYKQSTHLIH